MCTLAVVVVLEQRAPCGAVPQEVREVVEWRVREVLEHAVESRFEHVVGVVHLELEQLDGSAFSGHGVQDPEAADDLKAKRR